MKMFVADLDGTLFDHKTHTVKEEDAQAIRDLVAAGFIFTVATGRTHDEIEYVEKLIGVEVDYKVSNNGTTLTNKQGRIVQSFAIDRPTVNAIQEAVTGKGFTIYACDGFKRCYDVEKNPTLVDVYKVVDDAIEHLNDIDPVMIGISKNKGADFEDEDLMQLQKDLKEKVGEHVEVLVTGPNQIDIFKKGADKGQAVLELANFYGVEPYEVAVVGDGENDVPMFHVGKVAYVMSNAKDHVKKQAHYEVDSVASAVKHFMKNETIKID